MVDDGGGGGGVVGVGFFFGVIFIGEGLGLGLLASLSRWIAKKLDPAQAASICLANWLTSSWVITAPGSPLTAAGRTAVGGITAF